MKAIQTEYNGYKFRSRAEARWAVFFDEAGINYQYEPEGFEFEDGTRYLPDFYLPDSKQFFEVKGVMGEDDMHKIEMLLYEGENVAVGYPNMHFGASNGLCFIQADESSFLAVCPKCGKFCFRGEEGAWGCWCCGADDGKGHHLAVSGVGEYFFAEGTDKVKAAMTKAKQARFEFGECVTPEKKENNNE